MKNIKIFENQKYQNSNYAKVEDGIYKSQDDYGKMHYYVAITFEQEPEFEEGESSADISQYPLEDILDKFCVYVSDFFDDLNTGENNICYQEFCGSDLKSVQNLKNSIVGKHVYNKVEGDYVTLKIE